MSGFAFSFCSAFEPENEGADDDGSPVLDWLQVKQHSVFLNLLQKLEWLVQEEDSKVLEQYHGQTQLGEGLEIVELAGSEDSHLPHRFVVVVEKRKYSSHFIGE